MSIDIGYFWFRLFKTRGIGPKLLASIAKILEAENLTPEMLIRSIKTISRCDFLNWRDILKGKILEEDREKVSVAYEQLKDHGINIIYPGHTDFPPNILEIAPILFVKGAAKTPQAR